MGNATENLDGLLKIAVMAARKAATYLKSSARLKRNVVQVTKHDIKIKADKEAESIILDLLKAKTKISIISEETGKIGNNDSDLVWIVDPIDGTYNFFKGIPIYCISIAVWRGLDTPLLGVIYDVVHDELFTGIVGQGAKLNALPIKVSQIRKSNDALIFTGFPSAGDFSKSGLIEHILPVRSFQKVRWLGSAALSLAYVACGRGDVYVEKDIRLWDVAAGMAIVQAAGGNCRFRQMKKLYCLHVVAKNNVIRSRAIDLQEA